MWVSVIDGVNVNSSGRFLSSIVVVVSMFSVRCSWLCSSECM